MKQKKKRYLSLSLKLLVSLLALIFVLYQVEWQQALTTLSQSNWGWLMVALLFFNLSQLLSALRLQQLFSALNLAMTTWFNIKLYYLGMLYNLILPGGIGGDAYKVYYLRKKYKNHRTKQLFKTVFADRLSGLVALITLVILMLIVLPIFRDIHEILVLFGMLIYPFFFLAWKQAFRRFRKQFIRVNLMALAVQILQLASVFFIIKALGVPGNTQPYFLIFLMSSVATILPITIAGLGLRELVFLYASGFFHIDQEVCISLSLLFFTLTVVSAIPALAVNINKKKEQETKKSLAPEAAATKPV